MAATLQDIAERLNVSAMTVSRVFNKKGSNLVSEKTRSEVLKVAAELGYVPNHSARSLVTGRTDIIGLWIPSFAPYYNEITNQVLRLVKSAGYEMIACNVEALDTGGDTFALPRMVVDGVILADSGVAQANKVFVSNRLRSVPCVSIGGIRRGHMQDIDYVKFDVNAGMRQSVMHLVHTGCERIAFMYPMSTNGGPDEPRRLTYLEVMKEAGLDPEFIIYADSSFRAGSEAVRAFVEESGHPDGICCFTDIAAISCCKALREAGVRVPEDTAVMGFDGIEESEYSNPALSTIAQPIKDMCSYAWQFLQNRIEDPDRPLQQRILDTSLIIRESTKR